MILKVSSNFDHSVILLLQANLLDSELDFQLRLRFLTQCHRTTSRTMGKKEDREKNHQDTPCHCILDTSMRKCAENEGFNSKNLWKIWSSPMISSFTTLHYPASLSAMQPFPLQGNCNTPGLTKPQPGFTPGIQAGFFFPPAVLKTPPLPPPPLDFS